MIQHNADRTRLLYGFGQHRAESASRTEVIHMLGVNVDVACVFGYHADIGILRRNYNVKVIFRGNFVYRLGKAEHTLAPHEAFRSYFKVGCSDLIVTVHFS